MLFFAPPHDIYKTGYTSSILINLITETITQDFSVSAFDEVRRFDYNHMNPSKLLLVLRCNRFEFSLLW